MCLDVGYQTSVDSLNNLMMAYTAHAERVSTCRMSTRNYPRPGLTCVNVVPFVVSHVCSPS